MAEMWGKFKRLIGFGDDEYYEDDDYSTEGESYALETEIKQEKPIESSRITRPSRVKNSELVITVHEPLTYDESAKVVDDLRENKAVVLNFEQLEVDVKKAIFDFVSGAVYALDGKLQKVNKDIFVIAPSKVEIDGLKEELKNQGMFPW
ncbi:cell division protein SepF [Peptoniphilus sp.]|uniref:cell division protein SepF n=1 Tax=Peptoniphilus sp. TaxID=1971214 RepID=UPI003993AB65